MSKTLKTEIIAVGTELLLGQIANTNAQWISEELARVGVNTYFHTVVGDNMERLIDVFQKAHQRANVIIVTGGLGPTEDDLSREAFHEMSGIEIISECKSMKKIENFYKSMNIEMTENNRRQARVFANSTVLENKTGMAPGCLLDHEDRTWVFLPGVPREMKQLFTDNLIPFLKSRNGHMLIQSKVLKFIGIGESALETQLQKLIRQQSNPTIAPLAQKDGVTVRLTAKSNTEAEADNLLEKTKQAVLDEVGEFYFGENNEKIEEKIASLLVKSNKTIAAAESLTGGSFTNKLVSVSGASSFVKGSIVCYDTSVKTDVLGVNKSTIEQYGTVSEQCAAEMAKRVSEKLNAEIGISFTGVAGPDVTEGKKVGTVYIGFHDKNGANFVEKCIFNGGRNYNRYRSVLKGFEILLKYLK